MKVLLRLVFLLMSALSAAAAQAAGVRVDAVVVELVADRSAAVPGEPLALGLRVAHDPHWHTYWRNPGDSGLPTRFQPTLPDGWRAGPIAWPAPQRIFVGPLANYGYEGEVVLPVPVTVPPSATGTARISAKASWLMCKEVCIPGEASLSLDLPVASKSAPSAAAALFERSARLAPAGPIDARAALSPGGLALEFARDTLARAEFFPYSDALIQAPAPQSLYRTGTAGATRWRLDLKLADGVDAAAFDKAGFFSSAAGVIVLDGAAFEVRATRVAQV